MKVMEGYGSSGTGACTYTYVDQSSVNLCDGTLCTKDSNCESKTCNDDGVCGHNPIETWLMIILVVCAIVLLAVCIFYYCRRKMKYGGFFTKTKKSEVAK